MMKKYLLTKLLKKAKKAIERAKTQEEKQQARYLYDIKIHALMKELG